NRIEGNLEDYLAKQSENKGGANIDKAKRDEELLLLENNISRVISELSLCNPDDPNYILLEQEFKNLIKQKKEMKK
ncbi:MAG TPA: hypothetical protein VFC73_08785, partial [Syntrophomonadaceae bacterium]|nr:hypothetical protein [Syntrophomonadaceae bacterium]